MKTPLVLLQPARRLALAVSTLSLVGAVLRVESSDTPPTQRISEVIDRGQDFAVYRSVTTSTNDNGRIQITTNQFTLVENGLHYLEDGVWMPSEDVLESVPGGVAARRGPIKAVLSTDLAAETAFDLKAPDGVRLSGRVRQLLATDLVSGQSVVVGTPKPSAVGRLMPPTSLLFLDAFEGGAVADLVYVWKHNLFAQDIVLRGMPQLPDGWDPAQALFQVVTEMTDQDQPEIQTQRVQPENQPPFDDHAVIRFGAMSMILGKAFPVGPDQGVELGAPIPEGFAVRKEWIDTGDGRHFLVESLAWEELQACFDALAFEARNSAPIRRQDSSAVVSAASSDPDENQSGLFARTEYAPTGVAIDFIIYPDTPVSNFLGGQTYYFKSSYYSGSAVQFNPGCYLKFKNGTYMLLYGPLTFPSSSPSAVFTSRDDNAVGERIVGVPGEQDSDGIPTDHLGQPLYIYYVNFSTTIRNVRIRWATKGIQYVSNPGVNVTHYVQNARFEGNVRPIVEKRLAV